MNALAHAVSKNRHYFLMLPRREGELPVYDSIGNLLCSIRARTVYDGTTYAFLGATIYAPNWEQIGVADNELKVYSSSMVDTFIGFLEKTGECQAKAYTDHGGTITVDSTWVVNPMALLAFAAGVLVLEHRR